MLLLSAFALGCIGSLHCAGMCGPLALALPAVGGTRPTFVAGRIAYNFGRITAYMFLGALFGFLSGTLALVGLQRWASIGAGAFILAGLLASSRLALRTPLARGLAWLRGRLGILLQRRTILSSLGFGGLNGLLPCGLVYVACAGAVASGGLLSGIEYMVAFGLGTVPMMLGIGLAGRKIQTTLRFRLQPFIPAFLVLLGVLLILRGMSLGIPYVSPDLSHGLSHGASCH